MKIINTSPRSRLVLRGILIVIAVFIAAVLILFGLWLLSRSRTYQVSGRIVPRVQTSDWAVALTFDDGPVPTATDQILCILEQEEVKATFFLTGSELARYPDSGKRIVAAGHEVGNHTYNHPRMILKSRSVIASEIESTDIQIRKTGYLGEILFRPPYGKKLFGLPRYLASNNRITVTWDVDPESDPKIASDSDRITRHVVENVRPGSIILLHVMYESGKESMAAVAPVIRQLKASGYQFVTVSELLNVENEFREE